MMMTNKYDFFPDMDPHHDLDLGAEFGGVVNVTKLSNGNYHLMQGRTIFNPEVTPTQLHNAKEALPDNPGKALGFIIPKFGSAF